MDARARVPCSHPIKLLLSGVSPTLGDMIRGALNLCAMLLWVVGTPLAAAEMVGLELTAQVCQQGSNQWLAVAARNVGDAALFGLVGEVSGEGGSVCGDSVEALAPGEAAALRVPLQQGAVAPGLQAIPVTVHYTDERGAPFSDIAVAQRVTDFPPKGVMPVALAFAVGGRDGEGRCRVTSRLDEPVHVELALYVPAKAAVVPHSSHVVVPPGETVELPFTVRRKQGAGGHPLTTIGIATVRTDTHQWDAVAVDGVRLRARRWLSPLVRRAGWWWAALTAVLAVAINWPRQLKRLRIPSERVIDLCVLVAITAFIGCHVPPYLLVRDTLATGGDIPAHSYLASHLRDALLQQGKLVTWAEGWWCGFPMFQFYFPLPYLTMALLSWLLPFNIAFKLVAVSGIYALPLCAYAAARMTRWRHPLPALAALATVPLLLDATNTMWGVNIYSTLAGMIANSISFCGMLLFVASAYRDAADGRFRLRTPLLLVLVLSSHFFTSLMAILVVLPAPLVAARGRRLRALGALACSGMLGLLLMGWWLLPLIAKRPYSIDYGENWPVTAAELISPLLLVAAGCACLGVVLRYRRRDWAALPLLVMLPLALLLFCCGFELSPVFVNVRLWPFLLYAVLALGAHGVALGLAAIRWRGRPLRAPGLFVLPLLGVMLALQAWSVDLIRVGWAEWNFGGLEAKPHYGLFERLIMPLDGTPGRLANDLHPANVSLGSSRVFETVPHLIDKPILEGGLVNSALGSLAAYYIQSETSRDAAGAPPMVREGTFDMARASQHLRWMNVKHFVAKWEGCKQALRASPAWRSLDQYRGWELFELTSHDGGYVKVLPSRPVAVRAGERWKEAGLEWLYTPTALAKPVAILADGESAAPFDRVVSYAEFAADMAGQRRSAQSQPEEIPPLAGVLSETIEEGHIRFRTQAIGAPHVIKVSWFPNWRVEGAAHIYRIAPCFMLVYPEQEMVDLHYGRLMVDRLGIIVSWLGLLLLGAVIIRRRRTPCAIFGPDC